MKKYLICFLFVANCAFASDPETLIFSFQKQKKPDELQAAAQTMAQELTRITGKKVEVLVPTTYAASVQGLISNKVHVAYMDSLPFVLANQEAHIEIIAVEKRNNRTDYDSLIVVRKESPIKGLQDLRGKNMVFTSPTSTSGYLMPFARLLDDKLIENPTQLTTYFKNIIFAGGYDKALQALINGQADAAAFSDYVIEGKKADLYGSSSDRQKVRILARTSGVPTHLVAINGNLSTQLKNKVQKALLQISKEKPEILSSVYGAAELVVPENLQDHIQKTRHALKQTGLDVKTFVK